MDRRRFLQSLSAGLGLAALGCGPSGKANRPPNIVFILADDLGWAELGSYGNTFNETPHLDRLAAEGMRFTDAYSAAPVCSPMRASFITGQYPARVGISDYLRADDDNHLSPRHVSLPKALSARGYRCGLIGKWHLMGDYSRRRGDPKLHGFDEVTCSEQNYIAGGSYFHPYRLANGSPVLGEIEARAPNEYLTDRLNIEAVGFIERHRDEPFFLFLSHYSVHTTLAGKPDLIAKYESKPGAAASKIEWTANNGEPRSSINRNNPELAAMLESIDDGVGMILQKLAELRLAGNTVVIFTSDNGGEHRVTSNAPLRGAKSETYEGGIRVPLIVRWPSRVAPGKIQAAPVSSIDFYPTFLDIAARDGPRNQPLDGESLSPLLTGSGGLDRDSLFWHYPLPRPHFLGGRSSGAIRQGDFKLIEFFDTGEVELYNLAADLGERENLAARMPAKVAELKASLAAWRSGVGATIS